MVIEYDHVPLLKAKPQLVRRVAGQGGELPHRVGHLGHQRGVDIEGGHVGGVVPHETHVVILLRRVLPQREAPAAAVVAAAVAAAAAAAAVVSAATIAAIATVVATVAAAAAAAATLDLYDPTMGEEHVVL